MHLSIEYPCKAGKQNYVNFWHQEPTERDWPSDKSKWLWPSHTGILQEGTPRTCPNVELFLPTHTAILQGPSIASDVTRCRTSFEECHHQDSHHPSAARKEKGDVLKYSRHLPSASGPITSSNTLSLKRNLLVQKTKLQNQQRTETYPALILWLTTKQFFFPLEKNLQV